jgi:hypothetical protein
VVEGRHLFRSPPVAVAEGYGQGEAGGNDVFSLSKRPRSGVGGNSGSGVGRPPQILNAAVSAAVSFGGATLLTEPCTDLQKPVWDKVLTFRLNGEGDLESDSKSKSRNGELELRTLNLDGGRGFPLLPSSWDTPLPGGAGALHFRAFSDSIVSKDLLGEVAVDLQRLLASGGEKLVLDCIGFARGGRMEGGPDVINEVAVDTWLALRNGAGELRIQILVQSCPESDVQLEWIRLPPPPPPLLIPAPTASERLPSPIHDGTNRATSPDAASSAPAPSSPREGVSPTLCKRPLPWPALERSEHLLVSIPPWSAPLRERLRAIEDQFCYSYSASYSQTVRSDALGSADGSGADPLGKSLQLELLYGSWREEWQTVCWRRQLLVSRSLQEAVETLPPFRSLLESQRGAGGRGGVRVSNKSSPSEAPLLDLVTAGIPSAIEARGVEGMPGMFNSGGGSCTYWAGDIFGGIGLFHNMRASVAGVSVVRVSGHFCTAVYRIVVSCLDSQESWTVLRRYRDFRELYDSLPPSLTAVMAPLPPKSWRSLSHMTMTPEFLEERRAGLDAVVRRLVSQAASAPDASDIQAVARQFLGVSSPEHSASSGLELVLPGLTLSLDTDLRLAMWLLLSGAARRAVMRRGMPYSSLSACQSMERWLTEGGSEEQWNAAEEHFDAIDVDVNRTYVKSDREREALRRVLRSFALDSPSVGYCQAMNFVALFILRAAGLESNPQREATAFWLLGAMALDVIPKYWEGINSMTRVQADLHLLRYLAAWRMPVLLRHLDDSGLPVELLSCDWMLSLFCRLLPPLTVLRLWGWLLLEGADVLVWAALAVLRLAEDKLLMHGQAPGASANADAINAIAAGMHDADELIELALAEREAILNEAPSGGLDEIRRAAAAAAPPAVSEHLDFGAPSPSFQRGRTAQLEDTGESSSDAFFRGIKLPTVAAESL